MAARPSTARAARCVRVHAGAHRCSPRETLQSDERDSEESQSVSYGALYAGGIDPAASTAAVFLSLQ